MKSNKIFVEGLGLVEGHFSGIGQYILGMLRGMDDLLEEAKRQKQPHPEIYVVIPYNSIDRFNAFGFKHIKARRLPLSFRYMSAAWYRGVMPPLDLWCGPGHYLFTRFVGMTLAYSKSSVIVYDLSYELHKEFADDRNAIFLSRGAERTINRAENVFTISNSVKSELVEFYNLDADKVHVGYPAADQTYFFKRTKREINRVKDKYNINGDYIVALSNLEPRKNLSALIEAYCQMDKKFTDRVGLFIVGVNGWKTEELFAHIVDKVRQGYNIMRPSEYVVDDDRAAVISGAKMLVYPSHYEGFGMPPLEALACGVPVITAHNSSLPEAVGNIGVLTGTSPEPIAKEMQSLLEDWENRSAAVLEKGPEHAAKFSWKETARMYFETLGDNT